MMHNTDVTRRNVTNANQKRRKSKTSNVKGKNDG